MLIANGCSFTAAEHLYQLHENGKRFPPAEGMRHQTGMSWAQFLGQRIKMPVMNLAMGCGSNARILRTTIDFLEQRAKATHFVCIQWTFPMRFEFYEPFEENWAAINDNTYLLRGDREQAERYADIKRHYYTPEQSSYELLGHQLALKSYLNDRDIPFLYWYPSYWYEFAKEEWHPLSVEMTNFIELHDSARDLDGVHPSLNEHERIASVLYQTIRG